MFALHTHEREKCPQPHIFALLLSLALWIMGRTSKKPYFLLNGIPGYLIASVEFKGK